jgi:hypothetical protein
MNGCGPQVVIQGAVEGDLDEAVARRLVHLIGASPGNVYGKRGKEHLRQRVSGYNGAAKHAPWLVLVDLDDEANCPPPAVAAWLSSPARFLCLRFAVREIEAWLLADRERIAAFLGVTRARLPLDPEAVPDPKETMVNLARYSRRRVVREDLVPRPGSGRRVGPAYAARLIEFVNSAWDPVEAANRSESLRRSIRCLEELCAAALASLGSRP